MSPAQVEAAALALRLLLAFVLVRAALAKIGRADVFAEAVVNYRLTSERTARLIADWLPLSELVLGVMLLLGALQPLSGFVVAAMLVTFAVAVSINLLRGREIDCGCFGPAAPKRITWWTVGRNLVLGLGAVTVALRPADALSAKMPWESGAEGYISNGDGLAIGIAVVAALLGWQLTDEFLRDRKSIARFHHSVKETR